MTAPEKSGTKKRPDGGVVTQRTANPCTRVRFPVRPPSRRYGRRPPLGAAFAFSASIKRRRRQMMKRDRTGRRDIQRIEPARHSDTDRSATVDQILGQPRPFRPQHQCDWSDAPVVRKPLGRRRRQRQDLDASLLQGFDNVCRAGDDERRAQHRADRNANRLAVKGIAAGRIKQHRLGAERAAFLNRPPTLSWLPMPLATTNTSCRAVSASTSSIDSGSGFLPKARMPRCSSKPAIRSSTAWPAT